MNYGDFKKNMINSTIFFYYQKEVSFNSIIIYFGLQLTTWSNSQ